MANKKPLDREEILDTASKEVAVLGRTYKDRLSGLIGVATSRTKFLYACVRISLQPRTLKKDDGGPSDGFFIDEQLLTEVPIGTKVGVGLDQWTVEEPIPYDEEPDAIVLGNTYKDSITDFEGVAISLTKFLSSSQRVALQSSKLHDGKLIPVEYFDAHQLNEVKSKVKPKTMTAKEPGGPGRCASAPSCPKR